MRLAEPHFDPGRDTKFRDLNSTPQTVNSAGQVVQTFVTVMPPIRTANSLCPVCLAPYNSEFWLNKHIDEKHPRYRAEQAESNPRNTRRRSVQRVKPNKVVSARGIHSNHDQVDDPDAFQSHDFDCDPSDIEQAPSPDADAVASGADAIPTTYTYPNAGQPVDYTPPQSEGHVEHSWADPFSPFESEEEYNFAHLVTSKGLPATVIDDLLKGHCGMKESVSNSLKSNYHLRKKIDLMGDGLGHESWKKAKLDMVWNEQHPDPIEFWHRDIIVCAKWLLRQPAYEEHLTYAPKKCFDQSGRRVYNEMHTGDWWWDKQVTISPAVPMLFSILTVV